MEQYYKIAGLTVKMDVGGRTAVQAEPYLTEAGGNADLEIAPDWKAFRESHPYLTDDEAEYICTGGVFYRQILKHSGMLLHASAVVLDGRAYLFSAPSGTGKSTHTTLWQQVFPDAVILNDDKPALHLEDGKWFAYGTPWSGKTDLNLNLRAELAGICMLRRGAENKIRPFGGAAALHALMEQTIRPRDPQMMAALLGLLDKLFESVPVWEMECNMDPEAARVSYAAMSVGRKD